MTGAFHESTVTFLALPSPVGDALVDCNIDFAGSMR